MNDAPRIRIVNPDGGAFSTKLYLGEVELSHVAEVVLRHRADGYPTAEVTVILPVLDAVAELRKLTVRDRWGREVTIEWTEDARVEWSL